MPTFLDAIKLRLGAFSAIFQPSTMSADVTMLTPIKSGTILVDADWAAPGAIGGATPAFVASSRFSADGQAGTARQYRFLSSGSSRWSLYAHSDLESGSNAGSSLICSYYSDAGAYLNDLFSASRVTGGITFPNLATFVNGFSAAGAVTFTGAIASKNITSTGTRIGLAPTVAPPGGGFRYDFTAGASVAFVSVGPSSNLQVSHGASGVAASSIFNSGGSLALQWDASAATVQGNVLIGTGTNNTVDRLQVSGNISLTGSLKHTGTAAGFYSATAIAKPTVTGSRSGGAALVSLLSALSSLGLITDTTTT